jgi:CCR4-NOT transcription complex subunit 3
MSANRKLQTEIDRTLKKVEEGVEIFDEIWDKVYSATQQNQKEKYEVDLKKEIKKLQRHRDQIKTWVASSDIKDKRPLTDARKLIETKMEQFKVCEKETKTKTYSKEGLARETKIDPHEAAKNSTRDWLSEKVDQLSLQIDMHEADMEKLTSGKGSKRNKQEIEQLEASIKRHRWHIARLEQITRLLDNDALQHEQINEIKEDVEYYIDANQEPDFMDAYDETMDIFESLDLGDLPTDEDAAAAAAANTDEKKKKKKKGDDDDDDEKDDKKKKKKRKAG